MISTCSNNRDFVFEIVNKYNKLFMRFTYPNNLNFVISHKPESIEPKRTISKVQ